MSPYPNAGGPGGMKMAQLCQESGLGSSTIHYYLNLGILHKPQKQGRGTFLYDESHLDRLQTIRVLKEQEHLSLSEIKERLQREPERGGPGGTPPAEGASPQNGEEGQAVQASQQVLRKREQFLEAATELFSKKGFDKTTISDITDALDTAKGTFYLYFQDKNELFLECIERLARVIVPQEAWEGIRKERDYAQRMNMRFQAFFKYCPEYFGILNQVKLASLSQDPRLAKKAKDAFQSVMTPVKKDYRRAVADGVARDLDDELVTHMVLGAVENLGYKLMTDSRYTEEDLLEAFFDVFLNGIRHTDKDAPGNGEPHRRAADVTNAEGETIRLESIRFGENATLSGAFATGEVQLNLEKVTGIHVQCENQRCTIDATMTDGQKISLEVEEDMILSGEAAFGVFAVPLKLLSRISFV